MLNKGGSRNIVLKIFTSGPSGVVIWLYTRNDSIVMIIVPLGLIKKDMAPVILVIIFSGVSNVDALEL